MEICACIAEPELDGAVRAMARAAAWADLIELRLDYLNDPEVETLLTRAPRPCIVTNRIAGEGGRFSGTEEKRIGAIETALKYNPAMIDLELSVIRPSSGPWLKKKAEPN